MHTTTRPRHPIQPFAELDLGFETSETFVGLGGAWVGHLHLGQTKAKLESFNPHSRHVIGSAVFLGVGQATSGSATLERGAAGGGGGPVR